MFILRVSPVCARRLVARRVAHDWRAAGEPGDELWPWPRRSGSDRVLRPEITRATAVT